MLLPRSPSIYLAFLGEGEDMVRPTSKLRNILESFNKDGRMLDPDNLAFGAPESNDTFISLERRC
jgi:hypothetical protein